MNTEYLDLRHASEDRLQTELTRAAKILQGGGLVAFPTETVYGLGGDGTSDLSAQAIYAAKGRPSDNPLILHVADPADAARYAHTGPLYDKLAEHFMPGPLTVILPVKETVPKSVTAGLETVAIRCPIHPVARGLIQAFGRAIAAPSANLSGSPSPTCGEDVFADMNGRIPMIIDGGPCQIGLESTIVKITGERSITLLRPGAITIHDLEQLGLEITLSEAVLSAIAEGQTVESPGMKYRHYAPKTPFVLLEGDFISRQKYISEQNMPVAVLCYSEEVETFSKIVGQAAVFDLGPKDDMLVQANRLFYLLRKSDLPAFSMIYGTVPPCEGMGLALYNRMIRAAAHSIIQL